MKKVLLLFIVGILLGCSCQSAQYQMITGKDAYTMFQNGAIIIDVRTKEEYELEHISGAINIPTDQIDSGKIKNILSSYDSNIIVYCRSGARSKSAANILIELGYNNVYDLGSINNWDGNFE